MWPGVWIAGDYEPNAGWQDRLASLSALSGLPIISPSYAMKVFGELKALATVPGQRGDRRGLVVACLLLPLGACCGILAMVAVIAKISSISFIVLQTVDRWTWKHWLSCAAFMNNLASLRTSSADSVAALMRFAQPADPKYGVKFRIQLARRLRLLGMSRLDVIIRIATLSEEAVQKLLRPAMLSATYEPPSPVPSAGDALRPAAVVPPSEQLTEGACKGKGKHKGQPHTEGGGVEKVTFGFPYLGFGRARPS